MINWVKNPKGNKDFNEARWVTDEEGDWLFKLIRLYQPAVVFESGTANGYSTTWMAAANPSVIIHTYDPVDRPKVWRYTDCANQIVYHNSSFEEARDLIVKREGKADHSTGGIRRDWGVLSGALRRGDVIVFHDMNEPPVIRHVDRLTSQEADEHQADVLPELRNSKHYRIRTKRGMEVVVYEEN
jgi:hypothetical protein